jgi:hypothetical protein
MAVVLFGFNASVAVNFGQDNTSYFKKEVDKLEYLGGKPLVNVHKALSLAASGIFDKGIPYAARAVVVMTTGVDTNSGTPNNPRIGSAEDFESNQSNHVFAIELRENQDVHRLLDIASDYDTIFELDKLLVDEKQQKHLFFMICSSYGGMLISLSFERLLRRPF